MSRLLFLGVLVFALGCSKSKKMSKPTQGLDYSGCITCQVSAIVVSSGEDTTDYWKYDTVMCQTSKEVVDKYIVDRTNHMNMPSTHQVLYTRVSCK